MMQTLVCGIHNNVVTPISVDNNNKLSIAVGISNNKPIGKANILGLLCGIYRNSILPVRVDTNGRIII